MNDNESLLLCLKCNEITWNENNACNVCALQNAPIKIIGSEWGGSIDCIVDGKRKNMADHLNELERAKCDE